MTIKDGDELWELVLTRDEARAIVATIDALLEGENAAAFSEEERAALRRVEAQIRSDVK